jgi:chitin disaccharide deacetylase
MFKNSILNQLGYSENDRIVITHADDIGMCHASLQAYEELFAFGILKTGSVMVPCPWFPAAAALQARDPAYDLGVHLVLTSEWETYRWRPLTAAVTGSSLVDDQGFFPGSNREVQEKGDPGEVEREVLAQVQRARQFGIDLTHIDTHMGTIAHARFMHSYIQLAKQFQLPVLLPRGDLETYTSLGMDEVTAAALVGLLESLENEGFVLVDAVKGLPLDAPEGQFEVAKEIFGTLPVGLTHFIIHPSLDTPELRAITPDWQSRVANYKVFMNDNFMLFIEKEGIKLCGYREFREAMRSQQGAPQ